MAKLFFKPTGLPKVLDSRNFVNLDGGGFRAVAVALMDHSIAAAGKQPWMSAIIARYATFFPARTSAWSITQSRDLELQQLTYTLTRMALDELCAYPCKYPAAFKHHLNEDIYAWAARVMRSPNKHAVVAMANAAQLPVEIYVTAAECTITAHTCYAGKKSSVRAVRLLMQADNFSPQVDQPGVWRGIENLDYLPVEACPLTFSTTLEVIDEILSGADLARWTLYQENLSKLQSLSLDETDWMQIYQQNWRDITQIDLLECEHGLQNYFASLSVKYGNPAIQHQPWISAVARAITLDAFSYQSLNKIIRHKES